MKLKEHERQIYVSDISSVGIPFSAAKNYSLKKILNAFEQAERYIDIFSEREMFLMNERAIAENITLLIYSQI